MKITPDEAEKALTDIHKTTRKTRSSIAEGGGYVFLIITGIVWLVGFLASQYLKGPLVAYIWIGMSLLGAGISIPFGAREGRRLRSSTFSATAQKLLLFWVMLVLFGMAVIFVAHPTDGKQITLLVILFLMLGQMAMGLVLSFSATWWALPIAALALAGYLLLPNFFYLWMAVLGGGGMITLALVIRLKW